MMVTGNYLNLLETTLCCVHLLSVDDHEPTFLLYIFFDKRTLY